MTTVTTKTTKTTTTATTVTTVTIVLLSASYSRRFVDLFMYSTHSYGICTELYFNSLVSSSFVREFFFLLARLLLFPIPFLVKFALFAKAALFCFLSLELDFFPFRFVLFAFY